MTDERYPEETLEDDYDDGTMPNNVAKLEKSVVGRKIVSAEKRDGAPATAYYGSRHGFVLTLDDGTEVWLLDTADCCAFTELDAFLLHPDRVDHAITGVGTTDGYTKWHIYADLGDVLELDVDWSCGNPFYYGYGFDIVVAP